MEGEVVGFLVLVLVVGDVGGCESMWDIRGGGEMRGWWRKNGCGCGCGNWNGNGNGNAVLISQLLHHVVLMAKPLLLRVFSRTDFLQTIVLQTITHRERLVG